MSHSFWNVSQTKGSTPKARDIMASKVGTGPPRASALSAGKVSYASSSPSSSMMWRLGQVRLGSTWNQRTLVHMGACLWSVEEPNRINRRKEGYQELWVRNPSVRASLAQTCLDQFITATVKGNFGHAGLVVSTVDRKSSCFKRTTS